MTSNFRINDGTVRGDPTAGAEMTVAWWQRLAENGITVIPILDNPLPPTQVFECVKQHRDELARCAFEKSAGASGTGAVYQRIATEKLGVESIVDMNDVICPGGRCPAVIGNVLVSRHGSHLTRTNVETATGALAKRLVPIVDDATMQDQG